MKFTKSKLKQIIQEELEDHNLLNEALDWVNSNGTPNVKAMRQGIKAAGYTKELGNLQKWLRKPEQRNTGVLTAFRAYFNAHRKQKAAKAKPAVGGLKKPDTGQGMTGQLLKPPEDLGPITPKAQPTPKARPTPNDIVKKIAELQSAIFVLAKEVKSFDDFNVVIPNAKGKRGGRNLSDAIMNGWSALRQVKIELRKIESFSGNVDVPHMPTAE